MEDFAVIKQQIIDEMPAWVDELVRKRTNKWRGFVRLNP